MPVQELGYVGGMYPGAGVSASSSIGSLDVSDAFNASNSDNIAVRQILPSDPNAPFIVWDSPDGRKYETGIDRGVLYLSDGRAIPWNGLTSIVEAGNRESSSSYFDGMKINTIVSTGDYTATLKALTYPDEFEEIQGLGTLMNGVYLDHQSIKAFDLSYRTLIGTPGQQDLGYKIHILYNVIALPKDKTYATLTGNTPVLEFEWSISAVQQDIDGYSPTSHIVIDSTQVSPAFIQAVESLLYGSKASFPQLPNMDDFISFLQNLSKSQGVTLISITDNDDGTWTATSSEDDLITIYDDGTFSIINANATYTGDYYTISDTVID